MIPFLWLNLAVLGVCSAVAALDVDVQVGGRKLGRPIYGLFVLGGLLGVYWWVVQEGAIPLPGYGIIVFGFLYLPFLSHSFIDLDTTDRLAQQELEALLLKRDFCELRHASGQDVIRHGRRKLRMHWECRNEDEGIVIEMDVHPSLLPVTISRPHVATIRNQTHLERVRGDIRALREAGPDA